MKQIMCGLWMTCVVLISACTPTTEIGLPTLAALPTEGVNSVEVASTQIDAPVVRPRSTLPPTFTPSPEPTEAQPTPILEPTLTRLPVTSPPRESDERPECANFKVDYENSDREFTIGTSPHVQWSAMPNATSYLLKLGDETGVVLRDDIYVTDTSYSFDSAQFKVGVAYAWSVYPIDAIGDQMCYVRGAELMAQSGS